MPSAAPPNHGLHQTIHRTEQGRKHKHRMRACRDQSMHAMCGINRIHRLFGRDVRVCVRGCVREIEGWSSER